MCPKIDAEMHNMQNAHYVSAIGSIMYVTLCIRTDASYALSVLSKYQANPGGSHWKAVNNILKYLGRTKDLFLIYGRAELKIHEFACGSFKSDRDDRKSQFRYIFTVNGGIVSSKQDTTIDSTTEAKYIATSKGAKKVVWIKKFISELEVVLSIVDLIHLYCDNDEAKKPRYRQRSM